MLFAMGLDLWYLLENFRPFNANLILPTPRIGCEQSNTIVCIGSVLKQQ